ncbi:GlxA family transcriptional regulator [Sphingobium amiense]|uniref:GlxA family transcriptional regulator n=1 Tax=Sphingobium amiense TaxID=135719 RepID=A0A494W1P6_9SPHN|nr:DJ-1/PfpI family protein [Sphingobium amiense]BBD98121.1 GlxA family transcriptional regulator [Sphingobium amiense]
MRIACLLFEDFLLLDAAGAVGAFELAARAGCAGYSVEMIAAQAGPVRSSSGATLLAGDMRTCGDFHTLLIPGGDGTHDSAKYRDLAPFIRQAAHDRRRIASVCSGAFVLAEAGILDDRRAATHWNRALELGQRFPNVSVDAESLFVRDHNIWTSAGVVAGIDLALALIETDYGSEVARRVSQLLVVPFRRAGTQTQHSALLDNLAPSNRFGDLMAWARQNLTAALDVEALADRARLSARQFSRSFSASVGMSPAKAIEQLRVESARPAVESDAKSLDQIARDCGFGDAERMTRSFRRLTGETPQALRRRARERAERNQASSGTS